MPQAQYSFRNGSGTSTFLIAVTDDIIKAQDLGLISVVALLDFSKSFDTINHKVLCSKFIYYTFDNDLITLISS